MKKLISMLLCLTLLMSLVAVTVATAEDRTKISIAWLNLPDRDTIDPINGLSYKGSSYLKDLIEQKVPEAEIEFIHIPSDGWIQKMETTIKNNEADIGYYTNQAMACEWFVDHREFMKNDPDFSEEVFESTFTEGAKGSTRYHTYDFPEYANSIMGLPFSQSCYWIMFDKVLFEQWGVEVPEGPVTFEQLADLAEQMTGENPVTGKINYGTYVMPFWCEWFGVGEDMYHEIVNPEMDINALNIEKDVDYIKDDQNVLDFFTTLKRMIACSPAGATSWSGNEKWMTEDNDIAIMMHSLSNNAYINHLMANNTQVTDRFIPVMYPVGEQGTSMFPEFYHLAVTKTTENSELAWKVLKTICTDKDILNLIYANYAPQGVPVLTDPSGLEVMDIPFAAERYQDRLNHTFISDDYWYWREPITKIFSDFFTGDVSPEDARQMFYDNVVEWINNKKLQLAE